MTFEEILELAEARDALRDEYLAARAARDEAREAAEESLRRHRAFSDARKDAERASNEAWRAYRAADRVVSEAGVARVLGEAA